MTLPTGMRLPTGCGLSRRGGGGGAEAAFTPADLFASGEEGAWYDASDLTTLWTTDGRTTQVASDGDTVGAWDDKSGNGHGAVQQAASARPVYHTSGGLHFVQFDGVDDHLGAEPDTPDLSPMSLCVGYDTNGATQGMILVEGSRAAALSQPWAGLFQSGGSGTDVINGNSVDAVYYDGVAGSAATRDDFYNGVNGKHVTTLEGSTNFDGTVNAPGMGARSSFELSGMMYQFVVRNPKLSASERGDTESFVADKTGVTL